MGEDETRFPRSVGTSDSPPIASVIVPCRNAEPFFPGLLESVAAQNLGGSIEVIVVDNGSSDGSRSIARAFASRLNIRIVDAVDRPNASYARNVGARSASSGKLLFIDADDEIAPGYVAAMSEALDRHELVTSRVESRTLNPEWVQLAHGGGWQEAGVEIGYDFLPVTGVNIGIRRPLFEALGGYPEEFSGCQDIAFTWRAQLGGARIHFVPEAVYRYRHRSSLSGLYRQCVNWGASEVQLYRAFRSAGMPRRRLAAAAREWSEIGAGFVRSRGKPDRAALVTRLGHCVGRLLGTVRFGVFYP